MVNSVTSNCMLLPTVESVGSFQSWNTSLHGRTEEPKEGARVLICNAVIRDYF